MNQEPQIFQAMREWERIVALSKELNAHPAQWLGWVKARSFNLWPFTFFTIWKRDARAPETNVYIGFSFLRLFSISICLTGYGHA